MIDLPCGVQNLLTERGHDSFLDFFAIEQIVGDGVGVNHPTTPFGKLSRHGALTRRDAAQEAYDWLFTRVTHTSSLTIFAGAVKQFKNARNRLGDGIVGGSSLGYAGVIGIRWEDSYTSNKALRRALCQLEWRAAQPKHLEVDRACQSFTAEFFALVSGRNDTRRAGITIRH